MVEHLCIEYFRILPQYELELPIKRILKFGVILREVDILPLFHRNDWKYMKLYFCYSYILILDQHILLWWMEVLVSLNLSKVPFSDKIFTLVGQYSEVLSFSFMLINNLILHFLWSVLIRGFLHCFHVSCLWGLVFGKIVYESLSWAWRQLLCNVQILRPSCRREDLMLPLSDIWDMLYFKDRTVSEWVKIWRIQPR